MSHFLSCLLLIISSLALTYAAPIGGLNIIADLLKPGADEDMKIANGGPVGPGLSELVAMAEAILRKYGITKTFADIMDLDAGILAIASGILNINGKEGIIASPGKLLGNSPPKTSKLDAADQKLLPTDIYKPTRPATEQDGVKFHNVDFESFLPGVVDELIGSLDDVISPFGHTVEDLLHLDGCKVLADALGLPSDVAGALLGKDGLIGKLLGGGATTNANIKVSA